MLDYVAPMNRAPGELTAAPRISVVMAVFNGDEYLRAAVESILHQTYSDFEFIIVNDGSADGSAHILESFQNQDRRIRIIEQDNKGLTLSLARACGEARGRYIARQDADDLSMPQRLEKESKLLEAHSEVKLVSCSTNFIGPESEDLLTDERRESPEEATRKIRANSLRTFRGLVHGSSMFRSEDYRSVGGYRQDFYFAQDVDLWSRLTDHGLLAFVPEVLYCFRVTGASLSSRHGSTQRELNRIAIELRKARDHGKNETPLLLQAQQLRPTRHSRMAQSRGAGHYFLGRLLQRRGDPRAIKYLRLAVRANPFHLRARIALAMSIVHNL